MKLSDDQLRDSIDAFTKRTIYTSLKTSDIDAIADEDLLMAVFDNLSAQLPSDFREEFSTVMTWTKPQQAVYMIWVLEAEVNNGGFNQYYMNTSGQFHQFVPDALELVGAVQFADLTRRANRTFEGEFAEITQHQDGTLEGFSKSYQDNPLNVFDIEFYKLYEIENLHRLEIDFIRRNKTEFTN